jgi:hypothetical protein
LAASGCSDKDTYQWRESQVEQQLFKIQAVSGVYQGALRSAQGNDSWGNLSIDIEPDTGVQNSSDGLTSEQQAQVAGTVHVDGVMTGQAAYEQAYYDPDSGIFKIEIPVTEPDNSTAKIEVEGTIANNELTGRISAAEYPEYGGTFTLKRGGPAANTSGLSGWGSSSSPFAMEYATDAHATTQVAMSIHRIDSSPEQTLLDLMQPEHYVAVSLDLDDGLQMQFSQCKMDDTTQTIEGAGTSGIGSAGIPISLTCIAQGSGYQCSLAGSKSFTFNVVPSVSPSPSN